jgi:hypothetical protein
MANMCAVNVEFVGEDQQLIQNLLQQFVSLGKVCGNHRCAATTNTSEKNSDSQFKKDVEAWCKENTLRFEGFFFDLYISEGGNTLSGSTKWSPRLEDWVDFSSKHPELEFILTYDESSNDIGGRVVISNGEITKSDEGGSSDNGVKTAEVYLILGAALLPEEEVPNYINLGPDLDLESEEGHTLSFDTCHKTLMWSLQHLGQLSQSKGKARKALLLDLLKHLSLSYREDWMGFSEIITSDDAALKMWGENLTKKKREKAVEAFRQFAAPGFNE